MPQVIFSAAASIALNGLSTMFADDDMSRWRHETVYTEIDLPGVVREDAYRPPSYNPLSVEPEPGGPQIGIFGRRRVGGRVILSAVDGASKQHIVTVIAGAKLSALNDVYVDGIKVTRDANGYVTTVPWTTGNSLRVQFYDGTQTAADSGLTAAFTGWTSAAIGKKCAYAHITIDRSSAQAGLYDKGMPVVTFDVSGFAVYDPRAGGQSASDPSTWTYSDNAVLCEATYRIHELGARLPPSFVDWTAVAAAATVADEAVTLAAGGTEARYRCAYVWTTDMAHDDVCAKIGAAYGGGMFLVGTSYRPFVATTTGSTDAIGPGDYVGAGLVFADTPPISQRVNGVRGTFVSPLNGYELASYPQYQDAGARAEDGRDEWLDLPLDAVTSVSQAQRLARIAYKRARFASPATVTINFGHFDTIAGDVVTLTDDYAGFASALFRVVRESVSADYEISLEMIREFTTFYSWTAATDEQPYTVAALGSSGGGSGAVQTTGSASGDSGAIALMGGAVIDSSAATSADLFGTTGNNAPTTPNVHPVIKVWASPTTPAAVYRATLAYQRVTKTYSISSGALQSQTTFNGSIEITSNGDIDFGINLQNTDFNLADGIRRQTQEYYITSITLRAEASAGSPATSYVTLMSGNIAVSALNGATEAGSAYYALPAACCPYTSSGSGLSYVVTTNQVPGPRAANVELYAFTTNTETIRANGTLIGSVANGASMSWNISGTSGQGFYYRAYAKTSGGVYGPASNPLLVIFQ